MGLFEKAILPKKSIQSDAGVPSTSDTRYSAEEYEFLFTLVKGATFKGEHLEFVYNLILKLQEDYIAVKKSKE